MAEIDILVNAAPVAITVSAAQGPDSGGGGGEITVQDEGTPLATAATTLNFVGAGVVASGAGATKTITIAGDPTNITGNAATVTTNANLTGHVTSTGNATLLGSFTIAQLNTAISDADLVTIGGTQTITGIKTVPRLVFSNGDEVLPTSIFAPAGMSGQSLESVYLPDSSGGSLAVTQNTDGIPDEVRVPGNGSITGAAGAVTIAAAGTNQNITLTPSGTGIVSTAAITGTTITATTGFSGGTVAGTTGTFSSTVAIGNGTAITTSGATGAALVAAATAIVANEVLGTVRKITTGDVSRNNAGTGTTFTDDPTLVFAVEANTWYLVQFALLFTCTANSGFKGQFLHPALAPAVASNGRYMWPNATGDLVANSATVTTFFNITAGRNVAPVTGFCRIRIGASAGNLSFQWAQNVAHADNSTILAGSLMTVTKI